MARHVYAALIMRYRGLPKELKPSKLFDIALGLSGTSIAGAGLYAVIKLTLT